MSDDGRTVLAAFRRATQTSPQQHAATWARLQRRIAADEQPSPLDGERPMVKASASGRGLGVALAVAAAVALAVWAWSWRDAASEADAAARSQALDEAAASGTREHAVLPLPLPLPLPPSTATDAIDVVAPAPTQAIAPRPPPASAVAPIAPAPTATRAVEPASTADDALAREVSLMRAAREAALAGEIDRAVAFTDTHAREFPRGRLAHERWALRIDLLCRAGREDAARATALGFASAYPESTLAAERRATPCPHKP